MRTQPGQLHLLACLAGVIWVAACATSPPVERPRVDALAPSDAEPWGRMVATRSDSWFHLLNTGDAALEWRLRALDAATSSIELQTFIWKPDRVGSELFRRVLAAADRGVRVRILLDDSFTPGENDLLHAIGRHEGVSVRVYNPFRKRPDSSAARVLLNAGEFARLDHRMHNKLMVVDGRAAIVGGRNLADEYFGHHEGHNFRDFEVLTGGPHLPELSGVFDRYWNSPWAVPIGELAEAGKGAAQLEALLAAAADAPLAGEWSGTGAGDPDVWAAVAQSGDPGVARLIADDPATRDPASAEEAPVQLAKALRQVLDAARSEVLVVSAYLIPTTELEGVIEGIEDRGVQVRILTNSLGSNNHTSAQAAYHNHLRRLLGHGAALHEVEPRAKDRHRYMNAPVDEKQLGLHAKLLLIDDDLAFVGSSNLDPRSLRKNTEVGLLIESVALNQRLRRALDQDLALGNAWTVRVGEHGGIEWVGEDGVHDGEPLRSALHSLEAWFLGLLPIEGEL